MQGRGLKLKKYIRANIRNFLFHVLENTHSTVRTVVIIRYIYIYTSKYIGSVYIYIYFIYIYFEVYSIYTSVYQKKAL